MKRILLSILTAQATYANEENITPPIQEEIDKSNISSKSGFFLGVEGHMGGERLKLNLDLRFFNPQPSLPPQSDSIFSFSGGLTLGYQHYFTQNHGQSFHSPLC